MSAVEGPAKRHCPDGTLSGGAPSGGAQLDGAPLDDTRPCGAPLGDTQPSGAPHAIAVPTFVFGVAMSPRRAAADDEFRARVRAQQQRVDAARGEWHLLERVRAAREHILSLERIERAIRDRIEAVCALDAGLRADFERARRA